MLKTIIVTTTLLLSFSALADSECKNEAIAYRPESATLKEAANTFGLIAKHEISSCAVARKIRVTENQSIRILGFETKPDQSQVIHYRLDNYKDGIGTTSDDCRVQVQTVVTGKPFWDSTETVVSNPVCVSTPIE